MMFPLLRLRWRAIVQFLVLSALISTLSIGCVLDNTERQDAQPQSKNQSGQTEKTQGGQTGIGGDQTGTERPAQGKLRLYGFEPVTLDPAIVGDIGSYQYISQIFSGLVTIDENMRIAPDLAVGWTLSEDGKTYVFRLRQDAKFHNGTGVTADAFKYAIERATDPRTRSQIAQLYLGDIVGAMDKLSGKAQEVSGVRVKDPYNLEIEIDAPKSYFLAKLTYPTSYALDKNSVEGDRNWAKRPNGTGPFKLKSWQPDQSIVLQRNDLYYGKKASVAEVDFYLGGGSPVTMYERNEIDVASVSLADIDRVQDKKSPLNKELIVVPQLSLSYIGLNTTMKPFDDPKVRQAFAYATDKDKLANILFKKTRVTAKGILPPGMPGYNDQLSEIPFDPNRAKELIAQSSYGSVSNLPEITMTTSGGSLGESLAAMYKRNLGVDINVQQVDEAFHADLEARKYQMFFAGWIADYPDPQDFLDVLFHSQSNGNYTGFNDQQVDQLLEAARIEDDWPKSMTLYQRSEEQIVQQAPVVPLFHDVEYVLVKPRVKGFSISALGITALKNVELER